MRSTFAGEVRSLSKSDDGKYTDLAILQDGAANSTRVWSFSDADGLNVVNVGDLVEVDTYAMAKLSKGGKAYLSVQLRAARVIAMAGERQKLKSA